MIYVGSCLKTGSQLRVKIKHVVPSYHCFRDLAAPKMYDLPILIYHKHHKTEPFIEGRYTIVMR